MEKRKYLCADVEIVLLNNVDIITTSGEGADPSDTDWGGGQEW